VGHAGVVGRRKGVAQNQTDNLAVNVGPLTWLRQAPLKGAVVLGAARRTTNEEFPMIGKLTGTLLEKNPPQILVDCHGVGYEMDVPMSTFYNLPASGEKVALLTHFGVREDAQILYGFGTAAEREAFRQLIKISGVGPRTALSVLSGMSVNDLAQAVSAQEMGRIVKVPGIGKKTAERLLLELKGKIGADLGPVGVAHASDAHADIQQALMALGYNEKEAAAALKALPADVGVSDGIKLALKALAK
jgi:Holliday junction DNA helicase RuvA